MRDRFSKPCHPWSASASQTRATARRPQPRRWRLSPLGARLPPHGCPPARPRHARLRATACCFPRPRPREEPPVPWPTRAQHATASTWSRARTTSPSKKSQTWSTPPIPHALRHPNPAPPPPGTKPHRRLPWKSSSKVRRVRACPARVDAQATCGTPRRVEARVAPTFGLPKIGWGLERRPHSRFRSFGGRRDTPCNEVDAILRFYWAQHESFSRHQR